MYMNNKTNNQPIIVDIDEATQNVMEDIQSSVNASIDSITDDVKGVKNDIEQSTESIMKKLRGLNTLDETIDELRKTSQESMKLTEMVSPLNDNLNEIEKHLIAELETVKENLKEITGSVSEIKTNTLTLLSMATKLDELQNYLVHIDQKLSDKSNKLHEVITEHGKANNESHEKIMLVLNIIKNLIVTPFWKRKKSEE